MTTTTRPWRLWGLADQRLDAALTAVTVGVLLWSRFAYLASGPWEWDELNFARGILHFELSAHFPHPPGFPLYLLLGWPISQLPGFASPARAISIASRLMRRARSGLPSARSA